ncbi:MAG: hypothetical protein IJP29_06600 [Lachnospiraceae bacterium]|nr:hypothetical protein [Lachnospiraceae bacterium]
MEHNSFGFMNSFTLKMIAIITMVIDHVGYIIFPELTILRYIGRVSFPIFCFLIVEGFFHTRSHLNYLIRLIVFALLSEVPFDLAFHNTPFYWESQNVFVTLALGLFAIFCLEELNNRKIFILPLILIGVFALLSHCDYGIGGVLLICIFYLTKQTPWVRFFLVASVLYIFYNTTELYGLIAMIPITFYDGKRGPAAKMIFYWFYPLHLLLLFAIHYFLL